MSILFSSKMYPKQAHLKFIFYILLCGFIFSFSLLFPNVRLIIIRFGEIFIFRKTLAYHNWNHRLENLSHISLAFFAFLTIFSLFFIQDIRMKLANIFNKDFSVYLKQLWNNIPSLYKKSFLIVFLGLNIVFALHTTNFLWGNHEWPYLLYNTSPFAMSYVGRYFGQISSFIFNNGLFLPILNNLIHFAIFSLAAILLCLYWRLPRSVLLYSVVGLLFVLQPYTISWMYWQMESPEALQIPFYILLGFILGDSVSEIYSRTKRTFTILSSVLLFWLCLGIYQASISTMVIIFIGRIIVDIIFEKNQNKKLLNIIKRHIWVFISIVSSVVIYLLIYFFLKRNGIIISGYTNQMVELNDISTNIIGILKMSITYLIDYKVAFFPRSFTLLFSFLLVTLIITKSIKIFCLKTKLFTRFINISLFLFLLYGALVFSFIPKFITEHNTFLNPRIDFYGIAFFHMLIVVLLFQQNIDRKSVV
jgi:hypothetical protein